jgi:hypothetical protein
MNKVYINSKELCDLLNVDTEEFIDIEDFLCKNYDSKYGLIEGKDYRYVNGKGLREYTQAGAYTISEYIKDSKSYSKKWLSETKNNIKMFIDSTQVHVVRANVRDEIINNCPSLIKRGDLFFVAESDLVAIFRTKQFYFTKIIKKASRSDQTTLIEDIDYSDSINEQETYYSLSGIYKLSITMSTSLTQVDRRDYTREVGNIFPETLEDIIQKIQDRITRIKYIMDQIRKTNRCQVTGDRRNRINNFELDVHHLFDRKMYPQLADDETNMLLIHSYIHDQFHVQYKGGSDKGCTIDEFIDFIKNYYPNSYDCITTLNLKKQALGNPEPIGKSLRPFVLFLPISQVSNP